MGVWGAHWLEVRPEHVNAEYVLWATCRLSDVQALPRNGLVVRVRLNDEKERTVWMMLRQPRPEVCTSYPGRLEDLTIETDSETLVRWHLRHITFHD